MKKLLILLAILGICLVAGCAKTTYKITSEPLGAKVNLARHNATTPATITYSNARHRTVSCSITKTGYVKQTKKLGPDGGNLHITLAEDTDFKAKNTEFNGLNITIEPMFRFYNGHRHVCPTKKNVLPIQIKIANESDDMTHIQINFIKLYNSNGINQRLLSNREVISRLRYAPSSIVRRTIIKSIFIGPFSLFSLNSHIKANNKIQKYCNSHQTILTATKLYPDRTMTTYLYFDCPNRITTVKNWELSLNYSHDQDAIFHIF